MLKPQLVLVHGYARSGKTSLIRYLSNMGYPTVSTSEEIYYLALDYYGLPRYFIKHLQEKNDRLLQQFLGRDDITCRDVAIDTAENWYVPKFGRASLIELAFQNQLDLTNSLSYVFLETIGGEEADIAKAYWQTAIASPGCFSPDIIEVNIRSRTEVKGCDIRCLAPNGLSIYNYNHGIKKLAQELLLQLMIYGKKDSINVRTA